MPGAPSYSDLAYSMSGVRRSNPFDARRRFAQQMMMAGADPSPVQHPLQGAARLAQALAGGWMGSQVEQQEQDAIKAEKADQEKKLAAVMAEPDPEKRIALVSAIDPRQGIQLTGQLAVEQAKLGQQRKNLETAASGFGSSYGVPTGQANTAIASIESAGLPNNGYGAVGRPADAKGSRAQGRYQIMDYNVGPWTQEVLGKAMSPQEFLANPQAQDAVFNAKFNQYVQQFGSPEAAARAWFAGPGGMNNPGASDVNGMTVANYGNKFAQAYGPGARGPQIAQGSAEGMPPAPTPQGVTGPVLQAPTVPETPRPTPTPQQIAQYQQRLMTGEFGNDQGAPSRARAALEAELDRDWSVRRERDKMRFDQESRTFSEDRKPTEAQKAVDTTFGKEYAEWVAGGGMADTKRQIVQLEEVLGKLKSGANLTGPFIGNMPDAVLNVFNPASIETRNAVEEVVQRNLRLVLGAQFTEKEGERLIARAYNPALSEEENAKRVGRLLEQIKAGAAAKASAAQYYEQNGTLRGWSGKLPTIADFDPEARPDRGSASDLKKKYGLE